MNNKCMAECQALIHQQSINEAELTKHTSTTNQVVSQNISAQHQQVSAILSSKKAFTEIGGNEECSAFSSSVCREVQSKTISKYSSAVASVVNMMMVIRKILAGY